MFKDNIFTGTFQDYSVWFLIFYAIYFSEKTSKWRVIKRLPIASDYICNSGVDFISAVISAVTRKKREMFFQQKKSNITIDVDVIYCHSGFISFSGHDYWISHHCRIHLSMENVFINTFYFYIYCKHGKRRKYGALQTLATMAELLLSC